MFRDFKMYSDHHILSLVNIKKSFYKEASFYFVEQQKDLELSVILIIHTILAGLDAQSRIFKRSEEIRNMIKEAGNVEFSDNLAFYFTDERIINKGCGFSSELFNEHFNSIVSIISKVYKLKTATVNKLFALLTTVTLNGINKGFNLTTVESINAFDSFSLLVLKETKFPDQIVDIFNNMAEKNEKKKIKAVIDRLTRAKNTLYN